MRAITPKTDPYASIAHLYAAEHEGWDDDLSMYSSLAQRADGPILDLACGTARVGVALAVAGFEVRGIDASDAMLTIANGRARDRSVKVELERGDMRRLPSRPDCGAVICALDSFLHLTTTDDQLDMLEGVFGTLKPGGLLALDVFNPTLDRLAARDGVLRTQGTFHGPGGRNVNHLVSWDVDPGTQRIDATHFYDTLSADGGLQRRVARLQLRYIHRFELELALRCVGFSHIEIYGSEALEPYDGLGDRIIAVATKPSASSTS